MSPPMDQPKEESQLLMMENAVDSLVQRPSVGGDTAAGGK